MRRAGRRLISRRLRGRAPGAGRARPLPGLRLQQVPRVVCRTALARARRDRRRTGSGWGRAGGWWLAAALRRLRGPSAPSWSFATACGLALALKPLLELSLALVPAWT